MATESPESAAKGWHVKKELFYRIFFEIDSNRE